MKIFNRIKGNIGEELATNFLKKQKYKILGRNYRNSIGEIDIIAKDKKVVVFVEVKARSSDEFGLPCEAVDYRKQQKIHSVASIFLKEKKLEDCEIRFDVIEVLDGEINHIKDCF